MRRCLAALRAYTHAHPGLRGVGVTRHAARTTGLSRTPALATLAAALAALSLAFALTLAATALSASPSIL